MPTGNTRVHLERLVSPERLVLAGLFTVLLLLVLIGAGLGSAG